MLKWTQFDDEAEVTRTSTFLTAKKAEIGWIGNGNGSNQQKHTERWLEFQKVDSSNRNKARSGRNWWKTRQNCKNPVGETRTHARKKTSAKIHAIIHDATIDELSYHSATKRRIKKTDSTISGKVLKTLFKCLHKNILDLHTQKKSWHTKTAVSTPRYDS